MKNSIVKLDTNKNINVNQDGNYRNNDFLEIYRILWKMMNLTLFLKNI